MANFLDSKNKMSDPLPPLYEDHEPSFARELGSFVWETVKVVVISLAIILPIRFFVVQPFYVKGASMEPSFYDHEYLIIDEISYRFAEPARGEVVVFRYPENPEQFFIKRVIGLPRERVRIANGLVTVYGEDDPAAVGNILDEPYLDSGTRTAGEIDILLKDDYFYVLGDNRGASFDSRSFGPLPRENIIGKAVFRGWPLNRISLFSRPEY